MALGSVASAEMFAWGWALPLAFLLVGRGRNPVVPRHLSQDYAVRGASEEMRCFSHLLLACHRNDAGAAFQAHTLWLASLEVEVAVEGSSPVVKEVFAPFEEWMELQEALMTPEGPWCGRRLHKRLLEQRRDLAGITGAV